MRLDRVQVAVRPRGVLECLDLALLVCGRRPLGVAVVVELRRHVPAQGGIEGINEKLLVR